MSELRKIHHPHKVKSGDKWKVVDDDGHVYGTHDTEGEANAQLAALYANKDVTGGAAGGYSSPLQATTGIASYQLEGQRLRVTARARRSKVRVRATTTSEASS